MKCLGSIVSICVLWVLGGTGAAQAKVRLIRPLSTGARQASEDDVVRVLKAVANDQFKEPHQYGYSDRDIMTIIRTLLSAPDRTQAALLADERYEQVIWGSPAYIRFEGKLEAFGDPPEGMKIEALRFLEIYSLLEIIGVDQNPNYEGAAMALADFYVARFMQPKKLALEASLAEEALYSVVLRTPEDQRRMIAIIDLMTSPRFSYILTKKLARQGLMACSTPTEGEKVVEGIGAVMGGFGALVTSACYGFPVGTTLIHGMIGGLSGYMVAGVGAALHTRKQGGKPTVLRGSSRLLRRRALAHHCKNMLRIEAARDT